MYQVAQSDSGLTLTGEFDQYRFGHIQRHDAGGCGKRDQARASREGNANGESCVGITTGAHRVRQQHTVQPAVDNTVTRAQGYAAAIHNKVGQAVLHFHIHRFGVGRCVAEGLHGKIG